MTYAIRTGSKIPISKSGKLRASNLIEWISHLIDQNPDFVFVSRVCERKKVFHWVQWIQVIHQCIARNLEANWVWANEFEHVFPILFLESRKYVWNYCGLIRLIEFAKISVLADQKSGIGSLCYALKAMPLCQTQASCPAYKKQP